MDNALGKFSPTTGKTAVRHSRPLTRVFGSFFPHFLCLQHLFASGKALCPEFSLFRSETSCTNLHELARIFPLNFRRAQKRPSHSKIDLSEIQRNLVARACTNFMKTVVHTPPEVSPKFGRNCPGKKDACPKGRICPKSRSKVHNSLEAGRGVSKQPPPPK